jgi:dihydrofolate synthase/folylpolyglutamate synthase
MPRSIADVAASVGSRLLRLGCDFDAAPDADHRWTWRGVHQNLSHLPPPALAGDVQFDNAATVLTALECLADRLSVPRHAIEQGLQQVALAGRFQVFEGSVEWILDVAHNPAAASTLARQLGDRAAHGRTIAVCGILGDKDIGGIVTALRDRFDLWIAAGVNSPRGLSLDALAAHISAAGAEVTAMAPDVASACRLALTLSEPGDRIVVFGSFLTVAPALQLLASGQLRAA